INKLDDLKGKTLVSTAGTTNIKQVTELNAQRNLGMNIVSANGHSESFLMVESGRAVAFAMDDILLAGLVANSKSPGDYAIAPEALSVEPYGMMVRKDDAAFKKVVDNAIIGLFKSGEINKLYAKWFTSKIPPRGVNLDWAMSDQLKRAIAKPTSSGDPKDYQ
ncbi:MAG: amino acid ABC transporter substrate-binding protein, partial [Betaproteobacteria bacterium]